MAVWLSSYPYTRATSAYSAAVQLYARSGQLPTADNLVRKRKQLPFWMHGDWRHASRLHRMPHFHKISRRGEGSCDGDNRKIARKRKTTSERNERQSIFSDCPISWPLKRTQYYLGHVPPVKEILKKAESNNVRSEKLAHNIHNIGILLLSI